MDPVEDEFVGHPGVLGQGHDRARLAVVHRAHGIEQVGGARGARVDGGTHLVVGGVGVPDRRDRPRGGEPAHSVDTVRVLRREGDHPDRPPAQGDEPVHLVGVRVAQGARVVRPLVLHRDPRPLEVGAGDDPLLGELGQHSHVVSQRLGVRRDQTRHNRGRAVLAVCLGEASHGRGIRTHHRRPTTAMAVDVDEPRRQVPAVEHHVRGPGWSPSPEGNNAGPLQLHPTVRHNLGRGHNSRTSKDLSHTPIVLPRGEVCPPADRPFADRQRTGSRPRSVRTHPRPAAVWFHHPGDHQFVEPPVVEGVEPQTTGLSTRPGQSVAGGGGAGVSS